MDTAEIRRYVELMEEFSIRKMKVEGDSGRVSIVRAVGGSPAKAPSVQQGAAAAPVERPEMVTVKSPLVGIFYAAPAENAEPYVSLGDRVKKGQTLCIVEAMKLMNEISAEADGTIAEICATNGNPVESGSALFKIDVSGHE